MSDITRYSRQVLVEQVGIQGQQLIGASRVLVVGAGGLGCQVSAQLVGAGVGNLHVVDHDTVDVSNLHRQILFREADIGESKALCSLRELEAINSEVKLSADAVRVNAGNVKNLVNERDLVIDAADNFATSYLLSDACLHAGVPLLSASVNKSFGFLAVYCGTKTTPSPSLRALFPKLTKEQQSCDTVGVTGPSVGIIASLQAQEAIKVLTNSPEQLLGKILYANLWDYSMHCIDFSQAKEPTDSQVKLISAAEINVDDQVVDVREGIEVAESPQRFAVTHHIPLGAISGSLADLDKATRVVLACKSGQRALVAAQTLVDESYPDVAVVLSD
jgi:molybdopterin/thiamine biosynthesis adenylyltransferase/rhodanese-related sulfurtransferase